MSASVPPQHAPTPDGLDVGNGQYVLGNSGSLIDAIVTFSKAQPATTTISVLMFLLVIYFATGSKSSNLPVFNPQSLVQRYTPGNGLRLAAETKDNLLAGRKKYGPDQIFVLNALAGEVVALPPHFINEIRNDKSLGTQDAAVTTHTYIPGFETFANFHETLTPIVNKYINKVLGKLTKMLSDETTIALTKRLGEPTEWREIKIFVDLLPIVSRLSTRVFMGEEMCDNDEWLRVSSEYTGLVFPLVAELFVYPNIFTRKIVHHFIPKFKELRASLDRCRKTLQPVIDGRKKAVADAIKLGEDPPVWEDSLEWFRHEYGEIDFATKQIQMAMAAIHTTTDLLAETLVRVARHPEHAAALREEVVRVIGSEGWKKTSLHNLRFMDSFIKESQRLRPALLSTMQRTVLKDHKLSNGVVLRKGQQVITDVTHMWDSEYYPDPEVFDPYRFLKLRGTDKEHIAQLASTSDVHNGFGHGMLACPGRFFAANEIKIMFCHMILKYDWKLVDETKVPTPIFAGLQIIGDPEFVINLRKREPEIDLDTIEG